MFFDDVQWVDRATLDLLRSLLASGAGHLLLICAYRENEVSTNHPLLLALDEIARSGAAVGSIRLEALCAADVAAFVARALHG